MRRPTLGEQYHGAWGGTADAATVPSEYEKGFDILLKSGTL
jgi:hypothetical protein